MNVALLVPPCQELTGVPVRTYSVTLEDLGVGYIAAYLRGHGHSVTILDCQLQRLKVIEAVQQLVNLQPDVVGISISFQNTELRTGIELVAAIREAGLKSLVIAGGVTATFLHEFLLQRCQGLDMVCLGEGEETLLDAVQRLEEGRGWKDMPGIAYRSDSEVVRTPPRPAIADLDQVPFPARDMMSVLLAQGKGYRDDKRVATMESSRGCPYRCAYCAVPAFHDHNVARSRWRPKSVAHVLDEMEVLEKEWGIETVEFVDDNFIGPGKQGRERALAFVREYQRRDMDVAYGFWCRADTVEENLFRFLKDAGLCHVSLGIETGSQTVLDRYHKATTVRQNKRALEVLTKLGIPVTTSFIFVDPYTTLDELSETVQFCLETGAHRMLDRPTVFNVLVPFPGTPIQETITKDVQLSALGADPEFAGSTIFWQYQCLNPDVEMVRGIFTKLSATVQQRMDTWLSLRHGVQKTIERFEHLPGRGGQEPNDGHAALAQLRREVEKWTLWYNHLPDFLWTRYAKVLEAVKDSSQVVRSPQDLRKQLQESLTEYDQTFLNNTFEQAQTVVRRLITRAFASPS